MLDKLLGKLLWTSLQHTNKCCYFCTDQEL